MERDACDFALDDRKYAVAGASAVILKERMIIKQERATTVTVPTKVHCVPDAGLFATLV